MAIYTVREGDTVDLIAWRYYGRQDSRVTEQVLDANPHLADYGALLPGGLSITLPDIATPGEQAATVKLWD